MRFPHNAKIFRGQFEAAPYLSVFFLLVIFLLAHSAMVMVPGVPIDLPTAADVPGAGTALAIVAVDENGTFYFENQMCDETRLRERLREAVARAPGPLTLIARVHKRASAEVFTRLSLIARDSGIRQLVPEVRLAPEPGTKTTP
ncbi:MAG: Biopolymer transport protein ExbD/TolR [Verrucomicrobiota bacterium]|jgi:biopolymer transport protein ExbD